MIPMLDLKRQFAEIKDETMGVLTEILESAQFVLGPKVKELEDKVASYHGMGEGIGVASGTDALHLSLKALGIGEGDEVITSPFTFFATVEAIVYVGARPVFADIEPETFNIDPSKIEEKITRRTKAILPVHMFGHPADMKKIMAIAKKHNLRVVEDCAQSFGATEDGKKTGSFGDAGCFSFYPSKNLGAYGDAGMIVLGDSAVAGEIRKLRNHGSKGAYVHGAVGFNSRLDEMQAGILLVKFKRIDKYNEMRRSRAALYTELIAGPVACPVERPGCVHVYHQYTIRSSKRDKIQSTLKDNGIASVVYYPIPLHLQEALRSLGYKEGSLPEAERASKEVLSLPMYPELEDSAVMKVAETIKSV